MTRQENEYCRVLLRETGKQTSFAFSDVIGYDQMSYYYYGQYLGRQNLTVKGS